MSLKAAVAVQVKALRRYQHTESDVFDAAVAVSMHTGVATEKVVPLIKAGLAQ